MAGAARVDERDEQIGQRDRLAAHAPRCRPTASAASTVSTPHSSAASDRIGGVPQRKRAMPARGPIVGRERERIGVAEPAGERLPPALGVHAPRVPRMGPDERRRAGPAVQVLVAAADGEVGGRGRRAVAMEMHRHGAGRVRQIPDHERAGGVRRARQRRHVVHAAGAVVHVGQQHDGGVVVDRRRQIVGVHEPQRGSRAARGSGLGDVEVGRKVRALGRARRAAPGASARGDLQAPAPAPCRG